MCQPYWCRLAEKIRAARVNKERALQLQEKTQLQAAEAEYDKVYDKVLGVPQQFVKQLCRQVPCIYGGDHGYVGAVASFSP